MIRADGRFGSPQPASRPKDAPAIVRLSVNRAAITNDGGWQQDITWDELQRLS